MMMSVRVIVMMIMMVVWLAKVMPMLMAASAVADAA